MGLIVTCLVTRAIALFPLSDMTLSSVVHALTKMNAQFPSLRKMYSDNGSNFRGANREISESIAAWDKTELHEKLGDIGVTWEFGPAASGHSGGVWERLIGIVKRSLKACIGNRTLNVDQFDTLVAGVAGIVNRRPLTPANNDLNNLMVLSPAHFIYPYEFVNSGPSVLPPLSQLGDHLRSSWTQTREVLDDFWRRWQSEYVETLLRRDKWVTSGPTYKIGDVVLIIEPIQAREKWRLARITEITNSDGNHPRRFTLRDSAGNSFDRAMNGVVHIELGET